MKRWLILLLSATGLHAAIAVSGTPDSAGDNTGTGYDAVGFSCKAAGINHAAHTGVATFHSNYDGAPNMGQVTGFSSTADSNGFTPGTEVSQGNDPRARWGFVKDSAGNAADVISSVYGNSIPGTGAQYVNAFCAIITGQDTSASWDATNTATAAAATVTSGSFTAASGSLILVGVGAGGGTCGTLHDEGDGYTYVQGANGNIGALKYKISAGGSQTVTATCDSGPGKIAIAILIVPAASSGGYQQQLSGKATLSGKAKLGN